MKKTISACLGALASSAVLIAGCFNGGSRSGEDPTVGASAALTEEESGFLLSSSLKHALDSMCSQSQISDFMQEVLDEKADSVRARLLEYGASSEYLDTVTIDFKKPHDDPGMGANSRLSLHLVVPGDSTQPKVLNVRGGKGWVEIWKQLGDGSLTCAPPGNLIRSPLFLDLSVDPAVDITLYPKLKDDEKKEPEPKPLDYTDKALSSLDDMPESFTSLGKASSTAGAHDVGIIPNHANDCPPGSEYVLIHTDDEDSNNNSNTSGWTGAIASDPSGTTFGFCRVDGSHFQAIPYLSYAVLKLGSSCPSGSFGVSHHFDNENHHTHNYTQGNYSPSTSFNGYVSPVLGDTTMALCAFPATGTTSYTFNLSSYFPNLGISYGVFGTPSTRWLDSGHVHTDDEDQSVNFNSDEESNTWSPQVGVSAYIYQTMGQHRPNSEFNTGKVRSFTCTTPCPQPGSWYDGANCFVATPPAGTTPFTWSGNLYYSPVQASSCPLPGSWYDGANCFVATPPAGTTPFVYAGNLYYSPVCHP